MNPGKRPPGGAQVAMGKRGSIFEVTRRVVLACAVAGCFFGGCTAPRGPLVVTDPDPSVKIPAIKNAVRKKDRGAVKQLVADLNSDDPAVRFYAINGLQRITGERLGYDYYADDDARRPAVRRWQDWLSGRVQEARADNK